MATRKTSNKGGNYRGLHVSYKCDSQIQSESANYEAVFIKVLERDPCVVAYYDQPIAVGRRHIDFKSLQTDEKIRLYEVKPYGKLLKEDNLEKFDMWHSFCLDKGWEFWLVSDLPAHDPKGVLDSYKMFILPAGNELTNLKFLTPFSCNSFYSDLALQRVKKLFKSRGCIRVGELVKELSETQGTNPLFTIYNLIYHQHVRFDEKREVINLQTVVELNSAKKELIFENVNKRWKNWHPELAKKMYMDFLRKE